MAISRRFSITIALTNTLTTNLFNVPAAPGTGVGMTFPAQAAIIDHVGVLNKTSSAHNFSLYRGATGANAAGTEVIGIGQNVNANSRFDWYGKMRMDAADFLVGGADASASLVLQLDGELFLAG